MKTTWSQDYPYNANVPFLCPNYNNTSYRGRATVGCSATALAQVIAYLNIKNDSYDFSKYNQTSQPPTAYNSEVGRLFKFICDKIEMNYGCDGSGADPEDFEGTLKSWKCGVTLSSGNIIFNQLINELVRWNEPRIGVGFTSSTGHTWVWDGMRGTMKPTGNGSGRG
ncbi:MAG: C10 family peptidase [Prevotella sp.]|jgi:streptopain|nr:C10 family peptidase [Prevotella sp.]